MEITRCARRLADEHGLDGFTMEELAEQVGVSRRTLFNYVPGKIDAVLGKAVPDDEDPLAELRAGGPTGELAADMRALGSKVLSAGDDDVDALARIRSLLRSEPRLHEAMHERLEEIAELIAEAIIEREGDGFDPFHARITARISLCIFDSALERYLADPSVPAAEHYERVFDATNELFNPGNGGR